MARKRGGGHGGGGEERWLLTYSDLITLLLAFFIILYSSSKADLDKFSRLAKSFQQTFGLLGVDSGGAGASGVGAKLFDFDQLSAPQRQYMYISEKLQAYAKAQGLSERIAVNLRNEGISVTLSNGLLFPSGGIDLGEESQQVLAEIAELIRPMPNELRIEGHTDDLPTDSVLYPSNWELSAARAAAVARCLSEKDSVEARRLSVQGYGEYRPLYPNDTREHRLQNRRAEIVILFPTQKIPAPVDLLAQ